MTPFDSDSRQRDAYLAGFKDGWDFAIRGDILFGLRSQPYDLPTDLSSAWGDGWHEGAKLGGQKLLAKIGTPAASPRFDLSSTNQETRDAAAKILRETYIASPRTNWDTLIASLKIGMSKTNVLQLLKPFILGPERGTTSGTFEAEQFRLDDLWVLECYFDHGFNGCKLFPETLNVWVDPPTNFAGTWITYYVNGQKSHEIHYDSGKYHGEFIAYSPDGSKCYVQHYEHQVAEGADTGYFASGRTNYYGIYKADKQVGTWTWYNEDGSVKSTHDYSKLRE